ncbi:MAG TPA: HIT family protein [Candidatus Saccharimonadales bacterium]
MSEGTIFDKIVDGSIPSLKVWEDENYLAFLTPFGNTPGATVVIPKKNPGDYVFALDNEVVAGLMQAAKQTSRILEKAFNVPKIAAVFEGEGVPHLHVKLYPMHELEADRSKFPKESTFYPVYPGFISTAEGHHMGDEMLNEIHQKIQKAAQDEN